jgi:Tfp pilus assembly protein PilX
MCLRRSKLLRRLGHDERGFTMIVALMVMFIATLLAAAAFVATTEDAALTRTNTNQQKAYFAALAGINAYKYQITANPNYWQTCPKTESPAKLPVPGATEEEYSVKTLGANGNATCTSGKQATIVETSGTASGTFRVQSTGYSAGKERSIIATFNHPGFLDYVFLSNYEVEDPSTLPTKPTECAHYYEERKEMNLLTKCPAIEFLPGDNLNGPFHTNDAVEVCSAGFEAPTFGRKGKKDRIEMNGGHYGAQFCGANLTLEESSIYTEEGSTLFPPETDNELLETAEYKFSGRTVIELKTGSPNTMTVKTYNFVTSKYNTVETKNWPKNGVIYVENHGTCAIEYSPFKYDQQYKEEEEKPNCGTVYVKGNYTESLTLAAQDDVVINGNIETTPFTNGEPTGNATLGLIANNFVRLYHPVTTGSQNTNTNCNANNQSSGEDSRGWGSLKEPVIDAALLSTDHSWIVDNFECGNSLGEITIWGAIAQDWRGRVTAGNNPYLKNYNYDERLATKQPPSFLSPTSTSWKVARETAP